MGYQLKGSNGEFIKRKIIFAPPPHDSVVKITEIKDDIIVESGEVVENNFVLVKGYLNKSVEYNTANKEFLNKLMGNNHDEKKEDDKKDDEEKKDDKKRKKEVICELTAPEPQAMAVDGVVRHTTVWIPFNVLVKVEGAKIGDKVSVEKPFLQPLNIKNVINEIIEEGLIVGIMVNDVINVVVTVSEARE